MSDPKSWTSVLAQLLSMVAVTGIGLAGYHLAMARRAAASPGRPITAIVVVDTQALVQGKIDLASAQIASGQTFTEDQLTLQGQNFGTELLRALKDYRERGVLVVDRRHVLAIPVGAEVTQEVAARLGVTAKPAPDPFLAPSLD